MNGHCAGMKEKKGVCLWEWEQGLTGQENEETLQIWNNDVVYHDRGLDDTDVYIYQNSPNGVVNIVHFIEHEIYLKENVKQVLNSS